MPRVTLYNRILATAGILGFVGTIVVFDLGCPGSTDNNSGYPVQTVTVQPNPVSVRVGGSAQLAVTVIDSHGGTIEDEEVTWSSSDPTIATVSGNSTGAVVTGVRAGVVTITATSLGVTGKTTVTVSDVPVASVSVTGAASVGELESTTLTATAKDASGNVLPGRTVAWSSSDPTVASVGSAGMVSGNKGGTATITATIELVNGSAPITVIPATVAGVDLFALAHELSVGESTHISATVKDAQQRTLLGRSVTWSSSNAAIASVNADGLVTGVAAGGPVTITASCEGKSGTTQITVTAMPSVVSGRVINYVTGQGIGGAAVSFRSNDGVGSLLGGTTAGADGTFTSPAFSSGISSGVLVEASANGYVTGRILVGSVPAGATTYAGDVPLVPTSSMTGGISGVIRNARTAAGISGATVSVFNNVSSSAVATQTSDGNGNFSFAALSAGTYRLTASATGFQNAQRIGVAVGDGGVTANQDLVLSPSGTNAVTIVLTWGASPSDLDSHLTGPNPDASRFHVYYASRGNLTAAPFANLDVDDVSSYGPETITITQMSSGTYRYSVHDYSDRTSNPSSGLGSSGAKVQVYTAAGLAQTFSVPGGAGTLWTVFELSGTLDNPVITPRNIMGYASDPSAITAPPLLPGIGLTDGSLIGSAVRLNPKGSPR